MHATYHHSTHQSENGNAYSGVVLLCCCSHQNQGPEPGQGVGICGVQQHESDGGSVSVGSRLGWDVQAALYRVLQAWACTCTLPCTALTLERYINVTGLSSL